MKFDQPNQNIIITGSSGLIGQELLNLFISENINFFILERDVNGFFSNLNNQIVSKKISRNFIIINCAFDSKNFDNNFIFISEIINYCKNKNFKIIHWIQVSSISAYTKISDYKDNFFTFIKSDESYLDRYALTKIGVDRLLFKYLEDKLITKVTYVIPIVVTGGFWNSVLENKNSKYIPKDKKISTINSESLGKLIYDISVMDFGKRINFIIPNHSISKWSSLTNSLNNYSFYKTLLFFYKKYPAIYINNRFVQIIFSILYKFTKLHIFYLYKYIHSIEVVNSFYLNDKVYEYD